MAGTFRAIFSSPHLSLSKFPLNRSRLPIKSIPPFSRTLRKMASNGTTACDHVQEPSPKIAKLSPLLKVKKLSPNAVVPSRASALSAGYDLSSAVEAMVPARGKALVPTDLSISIPQGTYARIAPRSGLAWKHSIDVGAGVIDADYRGPVGVILFNHSDTDFAVKQGDRIAQMIIEQIMTPDVVEVEDLDDTVRGEELKRGLGFKGAREIINPVRKHASPGSDNDIMSTEQHHTDPPVDQIIWFSGSY